MSNVLDIKRLGVHSPMDFWQWAIFKKKKSSSIRIMHSKTKLNNYKEFAIELDLI